MRDPGVRTVTQCLPPTHPRPQVAKWKEEQTVLVVLASWGIGIYSALKIFGGKKEEKPAAEA